MSLFDMFKPAPTQPVQQGTQPAPTGTPATQGNMPAAPTVATDPNNPTAPVLAPAEGPAQENNLEQFKDLWNTGPNEGDGQVAAPEFTPESLQKVMSKANFAKDINPEHLAAITAGGEGAAQALANIMDSVAKQVMVQATLVSNKIGEQALQRERDNFNASLPGLLRAQTTTDHLRTTNPLFSNPAVKPVIEAVQTNLLRQYPNATPDEVTKMTQDFVVTMGESFAPKAAINSNSPNADIDWDKYLDA